MGSTKEIIIETVRSELPDHHEEVNGVIDLLMSKRIKDAKAILRDELNEILEGSA